MSQTKDEANDSLICGKGICSLCAGEEFAGINRCKHLGKTENEAFEPMNVN